MSGQDGTGPAGYGPMTGRGFGPCGRGYGRGPGWGRGYGWGPGRGYTPYYPPAAPSKEQEIAFLKAALKELEAEKMEIEQRLKELEKE